MSSLYEALAHFLAHPIPAMVILLGLLVFFHELGHFVVGRLAGIAVETFSIGFGPRIFGFTHGGTEYRVSWIPLGGYVKFAGSHPSEEVPPGLSGKAFLAVSLPRRAATVVAGPAANFLLAVSVYTLLGLSGIPHPPALIGEVIEGSAAQAAGIRYGDKLVRIDQREVNNWRDIEEMVSTSPGKKLHVTVQRDGVEVSTDLTPEAVKATDVTGKPMTVGRAGIALGRPPAILSLLAGDGAAAQAGLVTGDQVTELAVGGRSYPVQSYPDLAAHIRQAAKSGAASVDLRVQQAAVPSEKEEKVLEPTGALRTVTLALARAVASAASAPDREMMAALGMTDASLTIGTTEPGAEALMRGDILLSFNGAPLRDVFTLREQLLNNNNASVPATMLRAFKRVDVTIQLKGIDAQRADGSVTIYTLPVLFWGQPTEPEPVVEKYGSLPSAMAFGVRQTASETRELIGNVASLITGDIPLKALGGPMLIAKVAGDSARRGWQTFLGSMALISINLGLLNLFPIPVLDGGQLVLMGAEGVRRRPLREAAVENFQKVGFAMIMALVVLATYNDLSRFWKSMLESVVGLFQ